MRAVTPSFVAEFPLRATASVERELEIRLDAARNNFNAALGESLRVLDLLRQSKEWQAARELPRQIRKNGKAAGNPARSAAFRACIESFDFKSSMVDRFA